MNEICPCGPPFSTRPDTADMYVYRTAHMLPAFFVRHFHLGSLALWPPTVATFRTGSSIRNSPFAFRRRHKSFSSAKRQQQRQKQSTTSAKQKAGPKPNPPESIRTAKTRLQGTRNVLADKEYLRIVCYDACRFGGLCKLFLGVAYGAVFII